MHRLTSNHRKGVISYLAAVLLVAGTSYGQQPVDPISVARTIVRTTELDRNGHVNNARFVEWLEWGRWGWLEEHGFDRARLEGIGCIPNVVRVEVDYRAPASVNDPIEIHTRPIKVGEKSYTFAHEIRRGDSVIASGATVIANYDPAIKRSKPLPPELARTLEDAKP